jgi:hypothetical protein
MRPVVAEEEAEVAVGAAAVERVVTPQVGPRELVAEAGAVVPLGPEPREQRQEQQEQQVLVGGLALQER